MAPAVDGLQGLAFFRGGTAAWAPRSATALTRVLGAVRGDRPDLYFGGDLINYLGQHRRVTKIAASELDGSDLQRLFVDADVERAP